MLEREFQSKLIREIKLKFPGCIVLKNDEQYIQGIPDLTVLYRNKWVVLECKRSSRSKIRPNQKNYVDALNQMSGAWFIYPENKEEVFNEIQQLFEST